MDAVSLVKALIGNRDVIVEMAKTPDHFAGRRYYHGTPREEAGKSIMRNGLSYQELDKDNNPRSNGQMTPVEGRSYLTHDIRYAQIYAIGANMAGSKLPDRIIHEEGRYGYVFVFDGKDMGDIQPDEDYIGSVLYYAKTGFKIDPKYRQYSDYADFIDNLYKDQEFAKALLGVVRKSATWRQRKQAEDGDVGYFASIGKKAVNLLSDEMKLKAIEYGASVASDAHLFPIEAWRIDKTRTQELKKDGSNFFDVAEQVI